MAQTRQTARRFTISDSLMSILTRLVAACLLISPARALEPFTQEISETLVSFKLVPIPGGSFEFRDPTADDAVRQVEVKPFWMATTEVTWDLYDIFLYRLDLSEAEVTQNAARYAETRPSLPYGSPDFGFGHQGYAAICVSAHAAQMFCRWLSEKTGRTYRLPTEIEWEYACRAGGSDGPLTAAELDSVAWFWDNADDSTQPVGSKAANRWGLHDLLGNVQEWCLGVDEKPVVRGGCFQDPAEAVHPRTRREESPRWTETDPQIPKSRWWLSDGPHVGFRVVCVPEE